MPEINLLSRKLAQISAEKKRPELHSTDIWEYLHSQDKKLREKRDRSHIEHKIEQEEKELEKCTFQPNIKSKNLASFPSKEFWVDPYEKQISWLKSVNEKYFFYNDFVGFWKSKMN